MLICMQRPPRAYIEALVLPYKRYRAYVMERFANEPYFVKAFEKVGYIFC